MTPPSLAFNPLSSRARLFGSGVHSSDAHKITLNIKPEDSYWLVYMAPPDRDNDPKLISEFVKNSKFFYALLNPTIYKDTLGAAYNIINGPSDKTCVMTIRDIKTNQLFGCISFVDIKDGDSGKEAEIRFFIEAPSQKKKLGTQTIMRAMDWAIKNLGLSLIKATTDPLNLACHMILLNSGLVQTGFIPKDESPYYDILGNKRPRLFMVGKADRILNSLEKCRRLGKYTNNTPIIGFSV